MAATPRAVLGRPGPKFGAMVVEFDTRYAPGPVLDKLTDANRRPALVTLIETRAGVEDIEAIAAVDGVSAARRARNSRGSNTR